MIRPKVTVDLPDAHEPERVLAVEHLTTLRQVDSCRAVADRALEAQLDATDCIDHVAEAAERHGDRVVHRDVREPTDGVDEAVRTAD